MLATAVVLNLEKAPVTLQEEMAGDSFVNPILAGMDARHIVSMGLAAYPGDSNGVPSNISPIDASGDIAGDMYCNIAAEATGPQSPVGFTNMTDDHA